MKHLITCRFEWDMGHRLMNHKGKCANYHGHRYALLATFGADALNDDDMVADFDDLKPKIRGWIDEYLDHAMVLHKDDRMASAFLGTSTKVRLLGFHPTAERLVELIADGIDHMLYAGGPAVRLVELVLYETPNCSATWRRPA